MVEIREHRPNRPPDREFYVSEKNLMDLMFLEGMSEDEQIRWVIGEEHAEWIEIQEPGPDGYGKYIKIWDDQKKEGR